MQDHKLEEPLSAAFAAVSCAGKQLGGALRLPGMVAAAAARDPDAIPAVCILAAACHTALASELGGRVGDPRSLLQPATMHCLTYILLTLMGHICLTDMDGHPSQHTGRHMIQMHSRRHHLTWLGYAAVLRLVVCIQKVVSAPSRFVASGGNIPWLKEDLAVSVALQLVERCCNAGSLDDEAPLYQLLHNCSAALGADVSAVASAWEPAATAGSAAADAVTACAERAQAALAAVSFADDSRAAGGQQPGAASAQQRPAAQQPAGDLAPQQQPGLRPEPPQLEWESRWAKLVARALDVRQHERKTCFETLSLTLQLRALWLAASFYLQTAC